MWYALGANNQLINRGGHWSAKGCSQSQKKALSSGVYAVLNYNQTKKASRYFFAVVFETEAVFSRNQEPEFVHKGTA